jgi:hypothetical protein
MAEGVRARGQALTGRPGDVSDRGGGRTNRAGLAPGDTGADRWARGAGRACAKRYPRSGPCDQDRMGEIRPGRDERLRAALLLSAALRLAELRQARARVAPGSPEWVRDGENDTANSVGGGGKATNPRSKRGERRGEGLGRVGGTPVRDFGHGEGA